MLAKDFSQRTNEIIRSAGKLLEEWGRDPRNRVPQLKGDGSPITPTDLMLNDVLLESLGRLGFPIVSEEALPEHPPKGDQPYFLIDPLDGTKYYSRGEPEYAICVGLIENGKPIYGAIYDPIDSRLFWAQKGQGAFCDDTRISHKGRGRETLRVFSSGFHKRPEKEMVVSSLNIGEILLKGSALKFCDIAMGLADAYIRFGPTSEWDTAGAQIILEEAGCSLIEILTEQPVVYGKTNYLNRGIVAAQKDLIPTILEFLRKSKMGPLKHEKR